MEKQCRAILETHAGHPNSPQAGDRCPNPAQHEPGLCWLHHKAYNNKVRSRPLVLSIVVSSVHGFGRELG